MANLQKYLREGSISYTPSLLAIGLSSGSDEVNGSIAFDSYIQDQSLYPLSKIIDGDLTTFSVIESTTPPGHTGFDIDLRKPYEQEITLGLYIGDATINEYQPGGAYSWINLQNIYDGDPNTDAYSFGIGNNEVFGFEITFSPQIALNRFEITPASTDTIAYTYTVDISFDGINYITDSTFTMSSVDVAKSVEIRYRNDYDSGDGQQQKGNLDNKKIKKLRIYSTGNGINTGIRFSELDLFKLEYENPEGIYLDRIRSKNSFAAGNSGTWNYQVSYDGESFESVGNLSKSGYTRDDFRVASINQKVKIFRLVNQANTADERIYSLEVFYWPNLQDLPDFEFNDSVLETKAWNSSRYDGRQLEGAVVNEFRAGDTTYGKTPVLRKLDRTFYITSDIISLTETGSKDVNRIGAPIEDPTLQYIPGFSYVVINQSITVNDDLSITITNLNDIKFPSNERTGFDRNLQTIIPDGSTISLKSLNSKVKDRSNIGYNVFFNGGMLQPLFMCWSGELNGSLGVYGPPFAVYNPNGTVFKLATTPGGTTEGVYTWVPEENWGELGKFYKGGLTPAYLFGGTGNTPQYTSQYTAAAGDYIEAFLNNTNQRGFITLLSQPTGSSSPNNYSNVNINLFDPARGNPPIRLDDPKSRVGALSVSSWPDIFTNGTVDVINPLKNLSHLSTAQVGEYVELSSSPYSSYVSMSVKYTFAQEYENPVVSADGGVNFSPGATHLAEPFTWWGSWQFSILNEERPALLVELNKFQEFPDGIGDVPFVVLPENLHPFIKDNIIHFVAKAGINFGSVTTVPALDQTNRYPDRIGWKPPKPAPTPELEAAQEAKTEISFEQRRLLARQLAEQNRRRRLERLREEEENQRRNKRQSKREDRQEERKERKKRREERKENRRENRQERREDRREDRRNRRENRRNRRRNR